MLRLFVGISLPPEQKLQLSTICHGYPGIKWVDPGNYHVTVRFIGEVDEGTAADIDEALAGIRLPRFKLAIAGTGLFGAENKPRVLYAGLDRSPPLGHLHGKVETSLTRLRLPPDGRRFTPHVTLGNARHTTAPEIMRFVAAHNLLRLPPFAVESFQLVCSYPTKAGSIYEDAADYPLR